MFGWMSNRAMPALVTAVLLSAAIGATPADAQCQAYELSQLHADDAYTSDKFGVSMSSSGDSLVIGAFGDENETGAPYVYRGVFDCNGDLDGDGDIDLTDLAQPLSSYGTASGAEHEDGDVDVADLAGPLAGVWDNM